MTDGAGVPSVAADDVRAELERLRLQYSIGLEFNSSLDFDELLPKVFDSVLTAVGAQGGSIGIAEGDVLRCRLALGSASQKLVGTTLPVGTGFVGDVARRQRTTIVTNAMSDARFQERVDRSSTMVTLGVMATPMVTKGVTVGAIQVMNKVTGLGVFEDGDRELLEALAASAAVALPNAPLVAAQRRATDPTSRPRTSRAGCTSPSGTRKAVSASWSSSRSVRALSTRRSASWPKSWQTRRR